MDGMNAFDRQLASVVLRRVGPSEPVDDAAILTAITTTQSPKWRFQSMFSTTKFVIAGAILALFGGFLLSGILTQEPSDDRLPAVGASASATTQAEPTDAATSEPDPTAEIEADDTTTTSDLLPGVDLVTEEVEPGVYRVLGDGGRGLGQNVWDIAITPDGDAWVEKHRVRYRTWQNRNDKTRIRQEYDGARVMRLGEPGTAPLDVGGGWPRRFYLGLDSRGDVHVGTTTSGGHVLRDGVWQQPERGIYCEGLLVERVCWWSNWDGAAIRRIDHADDRSERLFTHEDLGLEPDAGFGFTFALGDDGTLWTSTSDVHPGAPEGMFTGDGMFTGLASYDGERWTTVEVDEPVPGHALRMAVAPDGTVWVALRGPEDWTELTVVQWDGASWDTFGPVDDRSWSGSSEIHFAPDGTVWFGATTFYDGSDFRRVEIPTSITDGELRVGSHAFGPDGSLWVVLIDMRDPESLGCEVNPDKCEGVASLYVITPEAVAATK